VEWLQRGETLKRGGSEKNKEGSCSEKETVECRATNQKILAPPTNRIAIEQDEENRFFGKKKRWGEMALCLA